MRCWKILLVLCFLVMPLITLADAGNSCSDQDPLDNHCPLDSWVYMLVLAPISVTLTGVFLRSQAIKAQEKNKNDNAVAINQLNSNSSSTNKQHKAA